MHLLKLLSTCAILSLLGSSLSSAEMPTSKVVKPAKRSLIGNSTMLASSGKWTLVPKGAVLFIPKTLQTKIVSKPSGKLLNWKDFLSRNGSWIHQFPVQMKQAQGKALISQDAIKQYSKLGKIVIATSSGAPISVNPIALQPPVEEGAQ